jgi:MerR family transcriptional regulator, light-induced transcriptional regulator
MDDLVTNQNVYPVYNIKAISHMVGLLPVTLRAWERRYGFLHPRRGNQGYRLYSENDLQTLRWVKTQVDSGMSISRAVDHLNDLRVKGLDPTAEIETDLADNSIAIETISKQLFNTITAFNNTAASETLRRAFAVYSVDQVLSLVVTPTLVEIGEAWHSGNLPVAAEHYASQFFMQHLMSMLATTMPPTHHQVIFAAGAPGEEHQIGLLMLVVMMRWRGWDIKYLGPNIVLDRLPEALAPLNPRMLLFSATTPEKARELLKIETFLHQFSDPTPVLVFGGQGFREMLFPNSLKAIVLDGTPEDTVSRLEKLLE